MVDPVQEVLFLEGFPHLGATKQELKLPLGDAGERLASYGLVGYALQRPYEARKLMRRRQPFRWLLCTAWLYAWRK